MADLYFYNQAGKKISITVDRLKTFAHLGLILPDTIIENKKGQKISAKLLTNRIKGLEFKEAAQSKIVKETNTVQENPEWAGLQLFLDELAKATGVAPEKIGEHNGFLDENHPLRRSYQYALPDMEGMVLTVQPLYKKDRWEKDHQKDTPELFLFINTESLHSAANRVDRFVKKPAMTVKPYCGEYKPTGRDAVQELLQKAEVIMKEHVRQLNPVMNSPANKAIQVYEDFIKEMTDVLEVEPKKGAVNSDHRFALGLSRWIATDFERYPAGIPYSYSYKFGTDSMKFRRGGQLNVSFGWLPKKDPQAERATIFIAYYAFPNSSSDRGQSILIPINWYTSTPRMALNMLKCKMLLKSVGLWSMVSVGIGGLICLFGFFLSAMIYDIRNPVKSDWHSQQEATRQLQESRDAFSRQVEESRLRSYEEDTRNMQRFIRVYENSDEAGQRRMREQISR